VSLLQRESTYGAILRPFTCLSLPRNRLLELFSFHLAVNIRPFLDTRVSNRFFGSGFDILEP
jgi:hypothetical protein